MRISDWSSDVCSSDLCQFLAACGDGSGEQATRPAPLISAAPVSSMRFVDRINAVGTALANEQVVISAPVTERVVSLNFADGGYVRQGQVIATIAHSEEQAQLRSEEHTPELQPLMRISYADFVLTKKTKLHTESVPRTT